jgi:hypothetical protein
VNYFAKKGDQKLGPYTLAELHLQVQLGKLAPTDLAQSEGMTEWAEISKVLGNIPIPATEAPSAAPVVEAQKVPLPFNLHWVVLLLLDVISQNTFNFIWALYLANWARKLDGENKPLVLVAMYPAGIIAGVIATANHKPPIGSFLIIAGLIAYIIGVFSIKSAMEAYYNSTEKYGLILGSGMTLIFSTVYLQYHINQIRKWQRATITA